MVTHDNKGKLPINWLLLYPEWLARAPHLPHHTTPRHATQRNNWHPCFSSPEQPRQEMEGEAWGAKWLGGWVARW
ncbi:hypothetical protein E2C01_064414 [Portunus trituberculatus]|uniref:Uncharacterized protein n=1 Tax=Portunus trituberculatus TaxID=210409 RepID=A0A5B7HJ08_PORTR|nr:hypothetical protein [Portunus trituberculatus]